VDDEATSRLMQRFYHHLSRGEGKADALRLAQREIREDYPHPYYWAGFVLSGDGGISTPAQVWGDPSIVGTVRRAWIMLTIPPWHLPHWIMSGILLTMSGASVYVLQARGEAKLTRVAFQDAMGHNHHKSEMRNPPRFADGLRRAAGVILVLMLVTGGSWLWLLFG
jgi:hypothetical protein